ncbi:MAG: hypothetical protein QOF48_3968 [Verrucomicrobiota bacterium]
MARIIIIDDDPHISGLIAQALLGAGYVVNVANEGASGMELCRSLPVDLLITDLVMPGMEGMETIRRFHKEFPLIPIIAISGLLHLGNVLDTAKLLGAVKTLAKPFKVEELLSIVKTLVPPFSQSQPSKVISQWPTQ